MTASVKREHRADMVPLQPLRELVMDVQTFVEETMRLADDIKGRVEALLPWEEAEFLRETMDSVLLVYTVLCLGGLTPEEAIERRERQANRRASLAGRDHPYLWRSDVICVDATGVHGHSSGVDDSA